jgi:hypothetical protein
LRRRAIHLPPRHHASQESEADGVDHPLDAPHQLPGGLSCEALQLQRSNYDSGRRLSASIQVVSSRKRSIDEAEGLANVLLLGSPLLQEVA